MFRFVLIFCLLLAAVRPSSALTEDEIQKFIDEAIKAGGGEVVIPPGVHVIEKGLRLTNAKKLRLIGLDAEESILQAAPDAKGMVLISGSCEEVRIEKLTLDGGWAAIVDHPDLKSPNKFAKIRIGRCFFQNQKNSAILFPKTEIENLEIDACSFRDITKEAIYLAMNASSIQITHNHFTRCGSGVALYGSRKCLVASNEISDCGTGIVVGGPGDKEPVQQSNIIALNAIERSRENGIFINSRTLNNSVIQNEIRDSKGDGIRLFGDKHVVKANRITDSSGKNIAIIEGKHQVAE